MAGCLTVELSGPARPLSTQKRALAGSAPAICYAYRMHERLAEADNSEEKAPATAATDRSPPPSNTGRIRFTTPIIGTAARTDRATTGWPSQARCPKSAVCSTGTCSRRIDPLFLWEGHSRADRFPLSKLLLRESPFASPKAGETSLYKQSTPKCLRPAQRYRR